MTPQPLPPSPWVFDPDAWPEDDCVAVGADLEPETVVAAYRTGLFPMPIGGTAEPMAWWSPLERGVLRPESMHVSRSLRRSRRHYSTSVDTAFDEVVRACADANRPGAWITTDIVEAYRRLYELGWAHSVETRDAEGRLVGGVYGLAIGGLFAGESMFHYATDASKVAVAALVDILSDTYAPYRLVDVQWRTSHLATFGVTTLSRSQYLAELRALVELPLPAIWR